MPTKSASTRANVKVAAKAVRRNGAKRHANKVRMTKVEAERLEKFKAMMEKYRGRGSFAGCGEPFSVTNKAEPRVGVGLTRDEVIERLRENQGELEIRGVVHAALFGSRARGEARTESDTDILIEFDPAARITAFDYAGLKSFIAGMFDGPVDVVNRDGLKPHIKPFAAADALYAF